MLESDGNSKAQMPTVEGMDIYWNHAMQAAGRLNM